MIAIYAITKEKTRISLNKFPLVGDIFDIMCWADEKTKEMEIVEFEFFEFKCFGNSKCEHLEYAGWVPYHPTWKCAKYGLLDKWSTLCTSCPFEIVAKERKDDT